MMLTNEDMDSIAEGYVAKMAENSNYDLMLSPEPGVKNNYGNIYYYNTRKALVEKNIDFALLGNGPFLVEKNTGKVIQFGTGKPIEYYLQEYESGRIPFTN